MGWSNSKRRALFASVALLGCLSLDSHSSVAAAEPTSAPSKKAGQGRGIPSRIRADRTKNSLPTVKPPEWDRATLDVFFANPRAELGPGGPRPLNRPSAVAESKQTSPAQTKPAAGWGAWISAETIEDEVKNLLAELDAAVATPGKFKGGGFNAARVQLSLVAALFGIIADYESDVRWKEHAQSWSELFGRAGRNCRAGSDGAYKEAKLRAADLAQLVRGDKPAPDTSSPEKNWAERVDRRPLMEWFEQARQERLGAWTADAGAFQQQAAEVKQQAELLAAIAQVIQQPGYEFADDEGYRDYARQFQTHALELRSAADKMDFEQGRNAVNSLKQSCDKCHADFRG